MKPALHKTRTEIYSVAAAAIKPRPPVPLSIWAEANRVIPPGQPYPGPWSCDIFPPTRQLMDWANDPNVRKMIVVGPTQLFKTELLINTTLYYIGHDPAPILFVTAAEPLKLQQANRIDDSIAHSPTIGKLRPAATRQLGSRKHISRVDEKTFISGAALSVVNAHSGTGLISRSIRIALLDECDRYASTAVFEEVTDRLTVFAGREKLIAASSPAPSSLTKIWPLFEAGTMHRWYIRCPKCATLQEPKWNRVSAKNGIALYICIKCRYGMDDAARRQAVAAGAWVAGNVNAEYISAHVSGLASPWINLDTIYKRMSAAEKLKKETGNEDALATVVCNVLAVPFKDSTNSADPKRVAKWLSPYAKTTLPPQIKLMTMAVDVQLERLWYEIVGWEWDSELQRPRCYGIEYGSIDADPAKAKTWRMLTEIYRDQGRYKFATGQAALPYTLFVDTGGLHTQISYKYCLQGASYRIRGTKGNGWKNAPLLKEGTGRLREAGVTVAVPILLLGVDSLKNAILAALTMPARKGMRHLATWPQKAAAHGYDEDFFKGLCSSEQRVARHSKKNGWFYVWEHNKSIANEPLDCRAMNYAAMYEIGLPGINKNEMKK